VVIVATAFETKRIFFSLRLPSLHSHWLLSRLSLVSGQLQPGWQQNKECGETKRDIIFIIFRFKKQHIVSTRGIILLTRVYLHVSVFARLEHLHRCGFSSSKIKFGSGNDKILDIFVNLILSLVPEFEEPLVSCLVLQVSENSDIALNDSCRVSATSSSATRLLPFTSYYIGAGR
jgi:hypothetical protein